MKFAYGLAGEGRGHSTRALSLATRLIEQGHEVRFFTNGHALDMLTDRFGKAAVTEISVPRFVETKKGISLPLTVIKNACLFLSRKKAIKPIVHDLKSWEVDCIISDLEFYMLRVARSLKVPGISFNSQNFMKDCRLFGLLPFHQQVYSLFVGIFIHLLFIRFFFPRPDHLVLIVKPFKLKIKTANAYLVGPTLSSQFTPKNYQAQKSHLLVYLRSSIGSGVGEIFNLAKHLNLKVRLYGIEVENLPAHVTHYPVNREKFVNDLFTADLLISTAGTQLCGEAAAIGIPTILIPEMGQTEQEINATLASKYFSNIVKLTHKKLTLAKLQKSLPKMSKHSVLRDGTPEAVRLIYQYIKDYCSEKKKSSKH